MKKQEHEIEFDKSELIALCGKLRDQDISAVELARIESITLADPDAMEFYQVCVRLLRTFSLQKSPRSPRRHLLMCFESKASWESIRNPDNSFRGRGRSRM